MQDIRLIGNDGEYLNLETQGGDKFRLVLDDALRAAVKRDTSVQLDAVSISPREIQDAVRAGASAEDVAQTHGVPLDYVEKFALTVVDEIGHIIASAQSVRVSIAEDRFSEATQIEFGEIVAERIASSGGSKPVWSAVKLESLPWQVTVTYELDGESTSAIWSYDQRKLVLTPENGLAVRLSAGENDSTQPSARLRPLAPKADGTVVIELEVEASPVEQPAIRPLSVVSPIETLTRQSADLAASTTPVEAKQESEPAQSSSEQVEPLSATADLLEALRKKRAGASATKPEPDELDGSAAKAEEAAPEPAVSPAPAAKKGRPSMPSWDEIVFGTKTED